jgi:hypothetical protein
VSSVIVAELWPSICWTTFTSAPDAIARACGGVPEQVRVQAGDADGLGACAEPQPEGADPKGCTVADPVEHQVAGPLARHMRTELVDEEHRDRDLSALVALRGAPDHALTAQRGHRLGNDRSLPSQVEAGDPKGGHLAEADAGVGEEQDDEPIHLIGAASAVMTDLSGFLRIAVISWPLSWSLR